MNGLQAINDRILEDARQNAEQIAENAKQRVDRQLADGERDAARVHSDTGLWSWEGLRRERTQGAYDGDQARRSR